MEYSYCYLLLIASPIKRIQTSIPCKWNVRVIEINGINDPILWRFYRKIRNIKTIDFLFNISFINVTAETFTLSKMWVLFSVDFFVLFSWNEKRFETFIGFYTVQSTKSIFDAFYIMSGRVYARIYGIAWHVRHFCRSTMVTVLNDNECLLNSMCSG